LGFNDLRVRHHELPSPNFVPPAQNGAAKAQTTPAPAPNTPSLARIEIGVSEMPKLLQENNFLKIAEALKKLGYAHVTLDLQGYRRGSVNEALKA
jgi:uncharacterized protein